MARKLTGNVGLSSSSPKKSQPDGKQRQDFGDRLRRLQIEFNVILFPMVRSSASHSRHVV
jgi:hypothetical protein